MTKIIPIDENSRILIEAENYALQFRRHSQKRISWRTAGYFPDLVSACLEYLNDAPRRSDNAIRTIGEIVVIIKEAETRLRKIIINPSNYEHREKSAENRRLFEKTGETSDK